MNPSIERLQASRQALVDALRPASWSGAPTGARTTPAGAQSSPDADPASAGGAAPRPGVFSDEAGWRRRLWRLAQRWWRHHPVHVAADMAAPALSSYGERHPWRFLGLAALLGATVVAARPWRLVSLTTLLLALFKSTAVRDMLRSAMAEAREAPPPDSRVNPTPRSTP